jgi:hypothetical protein
MGFNIVKRIYFRMWVGTVCVAVKRNEFCCSRLNAKSSLLDDSLYFESHGRMWTESHALEYIGNLTTKRINMIGRCSSVE